MQRPETPGRSGTRPPLHHVPAEGGRRFETPHVEHQVPELFDLHPHPLVSSVRRCCSTTEVDTGAADSIPDSGRPCRRGGHPVDKAGQAPCRRCQVSSRISGSTRTPATAVMKLVSPTQRGTAWRSEEHTSELQSLRHLV